MMVDAPDDGGSAGDGAERSGDGAVVLVMEQWCR